MTSKATLLDLLPGIEEVHFAAERTGKSVSEVAALIADQMDVDAIRKEMAAKVAAIDPNASRHVLVCATAVGLDRRIRELANAL